MKHVKSLVSLGLLMAAAGAANADVTANATVVTDYDFRGVTQTAEDPALQVGLDYAHESGFYAGTWGSNVDFGTDDPGHEIDVYAGFSGSTEGGFGWNGGAIYYTYPGASDLNFPEIYGKFSYNVVSAAVYYSNDFGASDESAYYVSGDVAIPAGPLSVGLHAGLSKGNAIEKYYALTDDDQYVDYGVGLSYASDGFTVGMKWITTDLPAADDRIVLSLGTAFPWK